MLLIFGYLLKPLFIISLFLLFHFSVFISKTSQVNLIEPNPKSISMKQQEKSTNPPIRLNKQNNIEWSLDIAAGETKEVSLKYTIDHPHSEDIDFHVVNDSSAANYNTSALI